MTDRPEEIRLLVLDIDGTIAGQSNTVRPPVIAAIQAAQAQGIQVAIATGRMYRSAQRFHQMIGSTLPLISYQGAWIQDPADQKRYRHTPVPQVHAERLIDFFEQPALRSQISLHFYIDDQLYVREVNPETEAYSQRSGITPIAVGDLRSTFPQQPTKVLAMSDDTNLIAQVSEQLRSQTDPQELYLTTSVATFLEATHPSANKGTAVQYLAEEVLGLQAHQVMTVGDNCNDLEMLKYAGIGVAMGDAPNSVKAIADWIAPSVEADGAAAAIEKFLLR
jgi:Cof subfamily protein (haloacid dehalogenase superfamily)